MVNLREIDGQPVAFGHQGAVWSDAMTLYDHLTGSVWSQPLSAPIMGSLQDLELELVPSTMTTWAAWRAQHPETLLYAGDDDGYSSFPTDADNLEESSILTDYFDDAVAFPMPDVRATGVANETVGGLPIAVVMDPRFEYAWQVFSRELPGGEEIVLELDDDGMLVDPDTGNRWEPGYGRVADGTTDVEDLIILPGSTIFTEQFLDYYPDGRIWSP